MRKPLEAVGPVWPKSLLLNPALAGICSSKLHADYLRQGGYVFIDVCLFVCLSVSRIVQKLFVPVLFQLRFFSFSFSYSCDLSVTVSVTVVILQLQLQLLFFSFYFYFS